MFCDEVCWVCGRGLGELGVGVGLALWKMTEMGDGGGMKMRPTLMMMRWGFLVVMVLVMGGCCEVRERAAEGREGFRVFVITSMAKDHQKMIAAAMPVLHRLGRENGFGVDITNDGEAVTEERLKGYRVVVMLQEAPFDVPAEGQRAIEKFVEGEAGGWGFMRRGCLRGSIRGRMRFIGRGMRR